MKKLIILSAIALCVFGVNADDNGNPKENGNNGGPKRPVKPHHDTVSGFISGSDLYLSFRNVQDQVTVNVTEYPSLSNSEYTFDSVSEVTISVSESTESVSLFITNDKGECHNLIISR